MAQKALLMILDGWGIGDQSKSDAIFCTPTPYIDSLNQNYPHSQLKASGEDVGLPDGQMGNSEVGHLNIGGGRVVYQDLVKINRAIADGSIRKNKEIVNAFSYARLNNKSIHFMGLVSDGGVHSSLDHLFALCDIAKEYGLTKVFVHCFTDGRDTGTTEGVGFVSRLQEHLAATTGHIADIVGRFYAMDRDKRWERVKVAYDMLVFGKGRKTTDLIGAMKESYAIDDKHQDEHIEPIVNAEVDGTIKEGDVVIFFNFRNDRAKEITTVLTQQEVEGLKPIPGLQFYCMTPYDASFKGLHIIFDKEDVNHTLAQWLSLHNKTQLHIAETEKYAHVTFFLNGGREAPFEGEDRILVPSPKVATYDLQPEMSAPQVTEKLLAAIASEKYDFIVVNYANGDMVGHTGKYPAIQKAVETVDNCVGQVIETAKAHDYEAIIIADHGNADDTINPDGTANPAHSLNPVPFIYVSPRGKAVTVENGRLADVAPSILQIMGLPLPDEMTGHSLISQ